MFDKVKSIGYPHSFDSQNSKLTHRGFAGHIVTDTHFNELESNPQVYELSFICPRGISGGPILNIDNSVAGLVIGNKKIEITVFSEKEILNDGNKEQSLEKLETLHLGIAVTSTDILNTKFKMLNGSLGSFLSGSTSHY